MSYEFKEGQKVRIPRDCTDHITGNNIGTVVTGGISPRVRNAAGAMCNGHTYELVSTILDNVVVDDVVVDGFGQEYTVAAVLGRVVFVENPDGHMEDYLTIKELKDNDWTVKGAEPETVEVTLEEVAKLKGVPVEQLRIKDAV